MFSIIFQTILSEIKSIYNWKVFWWPVSEFSGSSLHLAFQFAACFSCNRCQSYTAQRKESATAAISREARATHSFQRRAHALVPWDPTRWKLPTLLCPENKKWRAVMVKSFTRNRWMISSRLKVPNYQTQEWFLCHKCRQVFDPVKSLIWFYKRTWLWRKFGCCVVLAFGHQLRVSLFHGFIDVSWSARRWSHTAPAWPFAEGSKIPLVFFR